MSSHSILVLGAGSWGTALALVLARNGHSVKLWGHSASHIAEMQRTRQNQRYLPNITFPDTLSPISDYHTALAETEDLLISIPSHGFRALLTAIAPILPTNARLCWATKGLETPSGLLLHQVVQDCVQREIAMAVLSGPSFAKEVALNLPTAVTIAANDSDYGQHLVELFHNATFRPYRSQDMIGVQIGGAAKNAIAIAVGIADGLGLGANSRAALITRGLAEITRLGDMLGAQRDTLMGLAGLGDLVLTCTDNQSRNRRFGYALGQGIATEQALTEIGQVVEGIHAAQQIMQVAQTLQIEMPIVEHVYQVLQQQLTPRQAAEQLLARELKSE